MHIFKWSALATNTPPCCTSRVCVDSAFCYLRRSCRFGVVEEVVGRVRLVVEICRFNLNACRGKLSLLGPPAFLDACSRTLVWNAFFAVKGAWSVYEGKLKKIPSRGSRRLASDCLICSRQLLLFQRVDNVVIRIVGSNDWLPELESFNHFATQRKDNAPGSKLNAAISHSANDVTSWIGRN